MHVTHDPAAAPSPTIDFNSFLAVDIRVGTIVDAKPFPEARKPAWRLWIDFGPAIGVRKSSAQITENHPLETLVGQQVAAVVNFPPRQIGPVVSEVLTLGFSRCRRQGRAGAAGQAGAERRTAVLAAHGREPSRCVCRRLASRLRLLFPGSEPSRLDQNPSLI
ncbi:export-related chaperone CsaA [Bradyrhizobium japonicum]